MAKQYPGITENLASFIAEQKIFFFAAAAKQGSVSTYSASQSHDPYVLFLCL